MFGCLFLYRSVSDTVSADAWALARCCNWLAVCWLRLQAGIFPIIQQ